MAVLGGKSASADRKYVLTVPADANGDPQYDQGLERSDTGEDVTSQVKAGLGINDKAGLSPYAIVEHSSDQSISNNVLTVLNMDTTIADTSGFHDSGSNNSRITAPEPGLYMFAAWAEIASDSTGQRILTLRKNGDDRYGDITVEAVSGFTTRLNTSALIWLSQGDYIELMAFQNSGAGINVERNAGRNSPRISVVKMQTA